MKICLTGDLAASLKKDVLASFPSAEVICLGSDGKFDGDTAGVEVVHFSLSVTESPAAMGPLMELFKLPTLQWMQGPGAGIDHPIWQGLLDRGVRLTNASGIHGEPIAQYIFTYILHWERQVALHQKQQREHEWQVIRGGDLAQKTLGIVGYGGIGQAAARVGRAFGMRIVATRRSACEDEMLDAFYPLSSLCELIAESDYLLLCMPFNDETRKLIGVEELAAMRPGAVLINVARGGVVDEAALIETLREGRIRGASLDVVEEEPLPADSPLWSLENCVLTPHDAGYSPLGDRRLGDLFLENLRLFASGERMKNEIEGTGIERSVP